MRLMNEVLVEFIDWWASGEGFRLFAQLEKLVDFEALNSRKRLVSYFFMLPHSSSILDSWKKIMVRQLLEARVVKEGVGLRVVVSSELVSYERGQYNFWDMLACCDHQAIPLYALFLSSQCFSYLAQVSTGKRMILVFEWVNLKCRSCSLIIFYA